MSYITTNQAAEKWGISQRRVRILCEQGKIEGVIRVGKSFNIPEEAKKPIDGRFKELTIADLYEKIELRKKELDNRRPLTQTELERLNEDFMIEYTYNSNAIEGNTLTLRETALVLRGLTINNKPLKDHLEAVQHQDAFNYVKLLVSEKAKITEKIISEIHSIVLNDRVMDRGVYRSVPVRIMGAAHIPPNPIKIPELMANLVKQYNDDNGNIIKKIATFHLQFEGIHPFIDGNGRTGRLLANLELMKACYPPVDIKFSDRKKYYDSFDEYDRTRKTDAFERLFASYILERIEEYLKIIE